MATAGEMGDRRIPSIAMTSVLLTFLIVSNFNVALASVPASAPAPSSGSCSNTLLSLSPCVNFITGADKKPGKDCCSAFKSVVNDNVVCLCELFTSNNPLGQPIDQKRAQAMSTACKVTTPPVSECNAIGIPVAAPVTASGSASPPVKSVPPTDSGATNGTASPSSNLSPPRSVGVSYMGFISMAILVKFLLSE